MRWINLATAFAAAAALHAQTGPTVGFDPSAGGLSGCDGAVSAAVVFDDGSGPAVYVAGEFLNAGGVAASRVARFRNGVWEALGAGFDGAARALVVHDDGGGPAVYCGGAFANSGGVAVNQIARWNPATGAWNPVGAGMGGGMSGPPTVTTLLSWAPVAGGPAQLFAGGSMTLAGGATATGLAVWNGAAWSAYGTGLTSTVRALVGWTRPDGVRELVAGLFGAPGILRSTGGAWTGLGTGLGGTTVNQPPFGSFVSPPVAGALAAFDEGLGDRLFVGGFFKTAGGTTVDNFARWDGLGWSAVQGNALAGNGAASALGLVVAALSVADLGAGPRLYVGGNFTNFGRLAAWNGTALAAAHPAGLNSSARALALGDFGAGPRLVVGGVFDTAGGVSASMCAAFDGVAFAAFGGGLPGLATDFAMFDDGAGPKLFAAVRTGVINGTLNSGVFRRDGSGWTRVGAPFDGGVFALAVYDDGSGPELYAGGEFVAIGGTPVAGVVRWSGGAWTATPGAPTEVRALATFDDGGGEALYTGGRFGLDYRLGKFSNGTWTPVGGALTYYGSSVPPPYVRALTVFDDGAGPRLFAAGRFNVAGSTTVNCIGAWDGAQWSGVAATGASPGITSPGFQSEGHALAVHDARDGAGPRLYFGGVMTAVSGVPANRLAAWDGAAWTSAGMPGNYHPTRLASFDDGAGPALYAASLLLGTPPAGESSFRKLYAGVWTAPAGAFTLRPGFGSGDFLGLRAVDDGAGPALWAGGEFITAGGVVSPFAARWRRTAPFVFTATQPFGPGSIAFDTTGGPGGGAYFLALSFDPLNATAPGAGAWRGLHVATTELLVQFLLAAPPFVGTLDAAGASSFALPAGALPPWLVGAALYGNVHALLPSDAATAGNTPVAGLLLQ